VQAAAQRNTAPSGFLLVTAGASEVTNMPDMTRAEWRARRKISKSTHYKLKRLGLAPEETAPPGINIGRITEEADAAWERRMAELAKSETAKIAAARRAVQATEAGRIPAQSERHVSKRHQEPLQAPSKPRRLPARVMNKSKTHSEGGHHNG
jgi:hypothetical protein